MRLRHDVTGQAGCTGQEECSNSLHVDRECSGKATCEYFQTANEVRGLARDALRFAIKGMELTLIAVTDLRRLVDTLEEDESPSE